MTPLSSPGSAALPPDADQSGLEDRIASILADPTIPTAEKRTRLEDLREEFGIPSDGGEDYAPIETQLLHAMALLADGGHDYASSAASSAAPDGVTVEPATAPDREV